MRIIDSQVHIWDSIPEKLGKDHSGEMPRFSYEDLLRKMDEVGVDCAILVPRSFDGDRNDYALEAARKYPDRFAVMGRISLDEAGGKPYLQRLTDEPGMLGVRLTFHRNVDRPLLTDGTADWFWPEAERLQIPVMVHAPERLPVLATIAEQHPRLRIILDHMGFSRTSVDEGAREAVDRLLKLSIHPNIFVKVSSAPCYSTAPYPYHNIQEQIRRVVDAFGSHRCFWGSDLTRLPRTASYKDCITMFTDQAGFLSEEELPDIMGNGLARCLGWPSS